MNIRRERLKRIYGLKVWCSLRKSYFFWHIHKQFKHFEAGDHIKQQNEHWKEHW